MSEVVRAPVKAPEIKKENQVSKVQKGNLYQPFSSPAEQILFLQRTIGNHAVQKVMKSGALQAKLRIGAPGDVYEQEADRVAEQVMRMPQADSSGTPSIQRVCPKCEEKELKRQPIKEDEEEKLQRKPVEEEVQAKATSGSISEVNPDIESTIQSLQGGGKPLSGNERAFFEPRFGRDFSQVRLHTDMSASEMAREVNGRAFTLGNNVAFGAGQYAPEKSDGRRLIAHELVHVVQQQGPINMDLIQNRHENREPANLIDNERKPAHALINLHQSGFTIPQLQRQQIPGESYVGTTFVIENENAELLNEDLSPMKYKEGDEIPKGNKAGETKIIPNGSEVFVTQTKLDLNKKTYAYVYQISSPLSVFDFTLHLKYLGWTSVTNFKGKFMNVVTGTAPAEYSPVFRWTIGVLEKKTVTNENAILREGGPDYKSTANKILQGTYVKVLEISEDTDPQGKYVKVQEFVYQNNNFIEGEDLGWTSATNLTEGWSDIYGPNAAWEKGKYLGQVDLVNIVGTDGKTRQLTALSFPHYIKMVKAAEKEGINIGLISGFRDNPSQAYLYNGYINKKPGFNSAFRPGYSQHQNGTAFDLNTKGNEYLYNWLKENAWEYGFGRTVSSEKWHWEYIPEKVKKGKYEYW